MLNRCMILALAASGVAVAAAPARAAPTCSAASISVQGEPARFEWLAKTKARGNWRAKVRALAELGPDYANWYNAEARFEECSQGPDGIACFFTGTPCKK